MFFLHVIISPQNARTSNVNSQYGTCSRANYVKEMYQKLGIVAPPISLMIRMPVIPLDSTQI